MDLLKTIRGAWRVKEVRRKIIFTMLMLVIFRIGSNIPVPGIKRTELAAMFSGETGLLDLFDLFSGGSFSKFTIFALSITPYITASIIVQLFTVAFPYFERLAEEGAEGRKKMASITRYMTIVLALVQAIAMTFGIFRNAIESGFLTKLTIIVVLTAGTTFLMWLGEQINEYGVGNGISLLIFGGIVSRFPTMIRNMYVQVKEGALSFVAVIAFIIVAVLVVMAIIEIQQGTRKIPVQYAKRVVGKKMYGGQSTHIPMKVNQAGVIPIIFATSLLQFPVTLAMIWPNSGFAKWVGKYISPNGNPGVWVYSVVNILLIIAFTYFYTAITFKPDEIADNMRQSGGSVPGIRPGKDTQDYLHRVMNRLCLAGALFLAVVAVAPTAIGAFTPFDLSFGGTSLLIAVGVAIETVQQLENQLLMRNYEGFLK